MYIMINGQTIIVWKMKNMLALGYTGRIYNLISSTDSGQSYYILAIERLIDGIVRILSSSIVLSIPALHASP